MIQLCRKHKFVLEQITHNKGDQAMEFYNVKKRTKVEIAEKKCEKVVYKRETAKGVQERFQPPGSTASCRTSQRSIRFRRLHALPRDGDGSKVDSPPGKR